MAGGGPGGKEVGRISIRVVPDTSKFRRELQAKLQEIEKTVRATIPVDVDLNAAGAKAKMAALMTALKAQAAKGVSIKTKTDLDGFQKRMLADLAKAGSNIEAKIPLTADGERFRRDIQARIKVLEHTLKADIPVDLHIAAGQRAKIAAEIAALKRLASFGDNNNGFGRMAKSLGDMGDNAGSAGRQFLGLTRIGWIVVAVMAAAAPLIGLVAGILAGLPSLIAAFGAGAGAVALGLNGIKAAAQTLMPQLDALKASVSGVFEARLTPIFQQLNALFPTLQTGMGQVANGLSDIAQGFVNVVTSARGMSQIQTILANTGTFFSGLGPIIATGTQSFLTLAEAGSNAFGKLLAPLQNFANGFDEMVNRITSNGAFDSAMQGLSVTLDSLLSLFTRLMEAGVTAMGRLGGPLSNLINGLGDTLIALMPALTSLSALIGNVFGALGTALAPVITALTPAFQKLTDIFSTLLTGNIQALAPVLEMIANAIGTTLLTALKALEPMLPSLQSSFKQFTEAITRPGMQESIQKIAESVGKMVGLFIQFAPLLLQIGTAILTVLVPAFALLASLASGIIGFFTGLADEVSRLVTWFSNLISQIPEFANMLVSLIPGAFTAVVDAIKQFGVEALAAFVKFVADIVVEAGQIGSKILGAVGNLGSILVAAGKSLMDGLLQGIKQGLIDVLVFASGIAAKIAAVKGPLPKDKKMLAPAGEALMQGLQDGMEDKFKDVLGRAGEMAGEINNKMQDGFGASGTGKDSNFNVGQKLFDIGKGFADATTGQFMSDLGISGNGAIPTLARMGIDYGTKFIFNVSNIDEAMTAKNTEVNKQALQYHRRGGG